MRPTAAINVRRLPLAAIAIATLVAIAGHPSRAGAADGAVTRFAFEGEMADRIVGDRSVLLDGEVKLERRQTKNLPDEYSFVDGSQSFDVRFSAGNAGDRPEVGPYPSAQKSGADKPAGTPGLSFFADGDECSAVTGSYVVDQADYDRGGALTAFAARFKQQCDGSSASSFGTIAYNATVPVFSHRLSALALVFPAADAGTRTDAQILTLTNTSPGTLPITAVTVTGASADQFVIDGNGCDNVVLPSGSQCAVSVVFAPDRPGPVSADLVVADAFTSWGSDPAGELVHLDVGGSAAPAPATPTDPASAPAPAPAPAPASDASGSNGSTTTSASSAPPGGPDATATSDSSRPAAGQSSRTPLAIALGAATVAVGAVLLVRRRRPVRREMTAEDDDVEQYDAEQYDAARDDMTGDDMTGDDMTGDDAAAVPLFADSDEPEADREPDRDEPEPEPELEPEPEPERDIDGVVGLDHLVMISVLGSPTIVGRDHLGGRTTEIATRLALAPDGLATDAFGNDGSTAEARRKKTTTLVSRARTELGEIDGELVIAKITRGERYRINALVTTDLVQLERVVATATAAPSPASIDALDRALDLVRGRPFGDDPYPWATAGGFVERATDAVEAAAVLLAEHAIDAYDAAMARRALDRGQRACPDSDRLRSLVRLLDEPGAER